MTIGRTGVVNLSDSERVWAATAREERDSVIHGGPSADQRCECRNRRDAFHYGGNSIIPMSIEFAGHIALLSPNCEVVALADQRRILKPRWNTRAPAHVSTRQSGSPHGDMLETVQGHSRFGPVEDR